MDNYFDTVINDQIASLPSDPARVGALTALKKLGFPTKRDENWRYMDLSGVKQAAPYLARNTVITPELSSSDAEGINAIFINGYGFDINKNALKDVALASSTNIHSEDNAFALASQALGHDGVCLKITKDTELKGPMHLHHQCKDAGECAIHLRHQITLNKGASLTLVEHFSGDEDAYWDNQLMQITLEDGATLKHVRLIVEGANATHTSKCAIRLADNSTYEGFTLICGGKAVRSTSHIQMLGTGAHADIDGLSLAYSGQMADSFVQVEHLVPGATSDQIHRNVLAGRGKAAFQGRIIVARDAQKTNADQSCKSLLLDRSAEVNTKPELEIFADDVKCSHGATVGELDEKALYYMLARGIDPVTAKALLVEAFASGAFARVEAESVRSAISESLQNWLNAETKYG